MSSAAKTAESALTNPLIVAVTTMTGTGIIPYKYAAFRRFGARECNNCIRCGATVCKCSLMFKNPTHFVAN